LAAFGPRRVGGRAAALTAEAGTAGPAGETARFHRAGGVVTDRRELRLLPPLSTYLPLPQIAAELFLSVNTIKTQASSIYRKLGASTASQAVTRARQLGLLHG
jgi:LuxR family maltose regulon positive regulatory protein